jgi:tetratricopeptide (TPR) repeat protein
MDVHSRIDELRRRVEKDPASIAFASLAEELRKAGDPDEAVRVCRTGLERHPTYLSAHVTLGRALLALERYDEARTEIEYVLHAAPDNLLALKCLNELDAHPREAPSAPVQDGPPGQSPPEPAEPDLGIQSFAEPAKPDLRVQTSPEPPQVEPPAAAFASPDPRPSTSAWGALSGVEGQSGDGRPVADAAPEPAHVETSVAPVPTLDVIAQVEPSSNGGPSAEHPAVAALEDWQARIQADRAARSGGSGPGDRPR